LKKSFCGAESNSEYEGEKRALLYLNVFVSVLEPKLLIADVDSNCKLMIALKTKLKKFPTKVDVDI